MLRVARDSGSRDRGWQDVVGDRLVIAEVPGLHGDLGKEASGTYVGPILARALATAPSTDG